MKGVGAGDKILKGEWEPQVPICSYNLTEDPKDVVSVAGAGAGAGGRNRQGERVSGQESAFSPSLLHLALSSHSFHGFTHGLLISQELHGLDGLQVLVQFIDDGNAGWQVQLHDGLF